MGTNAERVFQFSKPQCPSCGVICAVQSNRWPRFKQRSQQMPKSFLALALAQKHQTTSQGHLTSSQTLRASSQRQRMGIRAAVHNMELGMWIFGFVLQVSDRSLWQFPSGTHLVMATVHLGGPSSLLQVQASSRVSWQNLMGQASFQQFSGVHGMGLGTSWYFPGGFTPQ